MAAPVSAPVETAPVRPLRFAALEVPTFRWYWLTSWISSTGDGMENVIRGLLVVQLVGLGAAPFWLGMMVFAHWIPFTLFSLYGGALADRYDNRKVQIVAQLLLMSAAFGVAAATLTGVVTEWWIFGLLLVHGFAGAIGGPAQQTLIHSIVGRDRLLSAVSLNSTARQLSQVIGPAIAGVIYLQLGPGWGFFVNGLTFVPLLVFLTCFIRLAPKAQLARQRVLDALREGIAFVRSKPRIGGLIGVEMLPVIFLGHTFNSLLVLFATDYLAAGTLGYSFLLVASGLGALAAALWMAYARQRGDPARIIVVAAVVEVAAILVFALSTSYALSFGLMIAIGAATVLTQSFNNTALQLAAPDSIRGRVMGAYSFGTQGFRVLNGPLLGVLATVLTPPLAVAGSALVVLAGLGGIVTLVPQLRRRDGPSV
ncbi:MAG TPA: MFS transporter [Candidatus Limnocylindria bacterium]|nr:MFS transporter [Candidatus Limnocylindria bacterium]